MAMSRVRDASDHGNSEQTLLLLPRSAEDKAKQQQGLTLTRSPKHPSSRRRLAFCAAATAVGDGGSSSADSSAWKRLTQLSSSIRATTRWCRRGTAFRTKWVVRLLIAALLSVALVTVLPCLVADPHARWQLLAGKLVSAEKLLTAVQSELWWGVRFLLLARGSRLRACEADSPSFGPLAHFSDEFVSDSSDGRSYEVSGVPPLVFSPSYHPSASSPYPPARLLACSSSSMRCDFAFAELFQADLVAELNSSGAATSQTLPFCTSPSDDSSSCQQWPFTDDEDGRAGCGSGVIELSESRQWWYYQHPMSCMRLARSIGSQHGYCVGREAGLDEAVVYFHMTMFGPVWRRQATLAVESFLVSQNLSQSQLLIWTDRPWGALIGVEDVEAVLAAFPSHVSVRVYDLHGELLRSQSLLSTSAAWYASIDDSSGYLRGDLMRLLLMHNYGGVYLDADVLLLRDFAPILGQQFLYKWGGHCDELNGAVGRMFKGSALSRRMLDELYYTPPRPDTVAWGNNLYTHLHAEQQAGLAEQTISPTVNRSNTPLPDAASLRSHHFTVFPACFFNPNLMVPEAFSPILRPELPHMWPGLWHGPFAYHLHGEVWDEHGFAARDPTYRFVQTRIAQRRAALWPTGGADNSTRHGSGRSQLAHDVGDAMEIR